MTLGKKGRDTSRPKSRAARTNQTSGRCNVPTGDKTLHRCNNLRSISRATKFIIQTRQNSTPSPLLFQSPVTIATQCPFEGVIVFQSYAVTTQYPLQTGGLTFA